MNDQLQAYTSNRFFKSVLMFGMILFTITASALNAQIIIDDFNTGGFTASGYYQSIEDISAPGAIAGKRNVRVQDSGGGSIPTVMSLTPGDGFVNLDVGDTPGNYQIRWGTKLFSYSTTSDLNLDASDYDRITVTFSQVPASGIITLYIIWNNDGSGFYSPYIDLSKSYSGPGDYEFLFSEIPAGFNFDPSDIDGITITMQGNTTPLSTVRLESVLIGTPNYGSQDIYTHNTKSGDVDRVTFIDDADEYNPSFSNDGKLVAHDVLGGSAPFGHSVYITEVSSGVSTPLEGAEGGNDPSWSPNGNLIAFDRKPVGDLSIYTVPADGGTRTLVRENAVDAEWSNNSKRLVFVDVSDESIRTIDVKSGSETVVSDFGINPSWSPNGKKIVFSDGNNLFEVSVKQSGQPNGSPVQLTDDGPDVYNQQPSWSNNSKEIVFHSNRNTVNFDFDIWTIDEKGNIDRLTGFADEGDFDPGYSKNGKEVAYSGFTEATTLAGQNYNETDGTLSVNENSLPAEYRLSQNYPNPFNPVTTIRFSIADVSDVRLSVYNAAGQMVKKLAFGNYQPGTYSVQWDGTDFAGSKVASGIYFYRFESGNFVKTNKMMLIK